MKGIDVSHWQNQINWKLVAASDCEFAFIKASEGTKFIDPKFEYNRDEARKTDLVVGFYHFAKGGDAKAEADHFVKTVGDLREGELLVLDWEIAHQNPSGWSKIFLDRVKEKTGVKALLYTNEARVKSIDWKPVVDGNFGLWVAKYGLNICTTLGSPSSGQWKFWAIWQYCSRGKQAGVIGNCDMNTTKMTKEILKKYGKQIECTHSCPKHCNQ